MGNRIIWVESRSGLDWRRSHAVLLDLGTLVLLCTTGGSSSPKPSRTHSLNQDNTNPLGSSFTSQASAKLWIQIVPSRMRTEQDTMTDPQLIFKYLSVSTPKSPERNFFFYLLEWNGNFLDLCFVFWLRSYLTAAFCCKWKIKNDLDELAPMCGDFPQKQSVSWCFI